MSVRTAAAAAAAMFFAAAGSAAAQSPEDLARWTAINAAVPAPPLESARKAILAADSGCQAAGAMLGVLEPVTAWRKIDEAVSDGRLANAWAVMVQRPQCPPDQVFARYILLRDQAGNLTAQMMHLGRSHLDLDSFGEQALPRAIRTVGASAVRDIPGCSPEAASGSMALLYTEIVRDTGLEPAIFGLRRTGAWRELWVFTACGRTLSVYLDLEASPDGVRATAAPWASLRR